MDDRELALLIGGGSLGLRIERLLYKPGWSLKTEFIIEEVGDFQ